MARKKKSDSIVPEKPPVQYEYGYTKMSIVVTEELRERLKKAAKSKRRSASDVTRMYLEYCLDQEGY